MQNNSQLPLTGIRVVDFGQQIAGPAVAMVLADLGATVVHIDPPAGPQWDHPANAILHRNKSCLRLDLKTDAGLQQALTLIDQADVVIESFRPGVMQRLGLDFVRLRQARPELITLSVPGFASNDELRREWKATEAVVAATSGAYTDMGFNRVLMGLNPSFSPLPLGSSYAVSLAASAVVMALLAREKSGRGDNIEVPVAAALMEGLSYNSIVIDGLPERYKTMREKEIEYRRANNIEMDLSYEALQEYLDPFYRTYECADGRMFYCVCPSHRNHAKRCLQVLGIYEELLVEGLPEVKDLHLPISEWDGETSIGVYPLPKKWADIISAKMKKAFLTRTSEEWGRIFGEGQIPGAPHRTTQEWVNSEHSNAAGLIIEVDDPEYGVMKQPGPLAWLEGLAEPMLRPRPRRNVSFDEALSLLQSLATHTDYAALRAKAPAAKASWLDGLRVLDLTNVIAGPHSGTFLTRFGAQVTKLDPVTPLYDPLIGTLFTFQCGMGKQSALVDITTDEGREVFNRLVRSVDLVLINAPERQMKPLGLDHDSLQAINPGVLFCRLDCLGGPRIGPKSNYIGYDDIVQANSGIMSRFGGPATPEEHAHLGTLDVNCGFAAGLGMAVALYHKLKTGEVTRARTSLSAVTNFAQLPFAFDYERRAPFDEPSGREALGNHALSHFYRTEDGWIFLDASPAELEKLEAIEDLGGIGQAQDRAEFLRAAFAKAPSAYWIEVLHEVDIAAAQPLAIETLREWYSREADGTVRIDGGSYAFSIYRDHPSGHCITQIDHYAIRPREAAIKAVSPTERFGHSTRRILSQVGYSEPAIDSMIERGVAGLGWGKEFLPS
ncbi:carnitine dehydratase [Litchfieldella anticariensis FP35 = DSM 16096]|uniref:Carnitine dehydratase n=1 Tax=Litchfieldella anticariensis (strain DSM 16096 / CECT 5854 / CIP 108499 / LMG 22089 / FP35) TaxID=1121939 RepID=S2LA91_LITA3|nr:CoA transferase [Halomonas anticariensis]EPC01636.1 carnitine dehydratase [Halomonas anticariensis FP35 = DSM 16096]